MTATPVEDALRPYLGQHGGGILLAVSGGPDSTALLHAAAALGCAGGLSVATVDHGLRPESAAEARGVADAAHRLGLAGHILAWAGPKPGAGIQAAARAARYRLLAGCAEAIGSGLVLTGHTRDDQAETVLMRLIAGSGTAGLAGMRRERRLSDTVRLARPFLDLPKADLVAYCDAGGLAYLCDPSNRDDRFGRARLRALMPRLAREGLSADRLCRLAERGARDEAALAEAARSAFAAALRSPWERAVALDGATLLAFAEAIQLRVIDLALDRAGAVGPKRLERLERLVLAELLPALREERQIRRTLRGALVEAGPRGAITVRPAPPRGGRATRSGDRLAAAPPDLLGKDESGAYIADKRPD